MENITKGEWILDAEDNNKTIIVEKSEDRGNIICQAPTRFIFSMIHWEANSKVIVAAGNLAQSHPDYSQWQSKLDQFDRMKVHLESIIDAQYNPAKSLSNLNYAVSNARDFLTATKGE